MKNNLSELENELLIALKELTENAEQAYVWIPHVLLEHAITRAKFAINQAEGKCDD